MKKTIYFYLFLALVIAALGVVLWAAFRPKEAEITVEAAKVNRIETMAELCTMEIYNELPVLDTVNGKVIFGIQKQQGSISYDMEKLRLDTVGDTIRAILPPETIRLYGSTEPRSWEVVDTKSLKPLHSGKLTAEEDNLAKAKIKAKSIARLRQNGTIAKARAEARTALAAFLTAIYRKPAKVE